MKYNKIKTKVNSEEDGTATDLGTVPSAANDVVTIDNNPLIKDTMSLLKKAKKTNKKED